MNTNVIDFFDDLIMVDGYQKLWNTFVPAPEEMVNGSISFFDNENGKKGYIYFDEYNQNPDEFIISFLDEILKPRLELEIKQIRKSLVNCFSSPDVLAVKTDFVESLSTQLENLHNNTDNKFPTDVQLEIKNYLGLVQHLLVNLYKAKPVIPFKELNSQACLQENEIILCFGSKPNLKPEHLISLCKDLNDILTNGFIKSDYNDFYKLLFSRNVLAENIKIQFSCKTIEAAYVLDQLSNYFREMDPTTIELSQSFYTNSKKTVLTATNIYKSRLINKSLAKDSIDLAFEKLASRC